MVQKTRYGFRGHNFVDLTGKKFGMLTVAELIGPTKSGMAWALKCDCGNFVTRLSSNFTKKQHRHSCGCISKNPPKKDAGIKRMFNDYKGSAWSRGYSFRLSLRQFSKIVFKTCHYCGEPPSSRYAKFVAISFFANGIDRLDNNVGYTLNNCVPCCKLCNRGKNDLSPKEFVEWAKRIARFSK